MTRIINTAAISAIARDARAMGLGVVRGHLPGRHPTIDVAVKGYGTVTVRRDSSDALVLRDIFTNHCYDLRYFAHWSTTIAPRYAEILAAGRRPLIVDAGANNGASARWFAHLFPRARVVAVEPDPVNADLCRRNTADLDVDVREQAISSTTGRVRLLRTDRADWAVATERAEDGEITTCTIPDLFAAHAEVADPFLVKIDIEGFEADLFAGNTDWLDTVAVVIIEPHDWMLPGRGSSRGFQSAFAERDFDVLLRGENLVYVRRNQTTADANGIRERAAA